MMIANLLIFAAVLLLVQPGALAFQVISRTSLTHQQITKSAILQTTAEVCKARAEQQGQNFVMPDLLTAESLAAACSSPQSANNFRSVINDVANRNAWVDGRHVFDEEYHFDDESFLRGRDVITSGVDTVKANTEQQNFETARERLGETMHTLQDFYSHSNWIELGNQSPYTTLIRPNLPINNIADRNTPTCRSCVGDNCDNNILDTIIAEKKLTSGYFSLTSFSKPSGKCSHGGTFDLTSRTEPTGGINKDGFGSEHGSLHLQAANAAISATSELLEDLRASVGNNDFLRLMGISQTFNVLCIVIDTSESMADDIAEVRRITSFIIDSTKGTTDEPSDYILVPFNDPEFGPLTRTTDAEEFKRLINAISPAGGGTDTAEMSLSGLWLALAGAPLRSQIFLFTDAEPKDAELKSTVLALIESTKSTVNFLLTNARSTRRRLSNSLNQIYQELAEASGGQAIEVTKDTLSQATSIIEDTSSSALVTLFFVVRSPPKAEHFSILVDSSVTNLTIYITGISPTFTVTSPSGLSQSSTEANGSLGTIQTVGNFHTMRPNNQNQTGLWQISVNSTQPYSVKVTGQSTIDFFFDVVEVFLVPHRGYTVLASRPQTTAGGNVSVVLSVTGGDSVKLTEAAAVETMGTETIVGSLEELGNGEYLVTFGTAPRGSFGIHVTGQDNTGSSQISFQRYSSAQLRTSNVSVTAVANGIWTPGMTFSLPFTVETSQSGGSFSITVRNNRLYNMTFPSSLVIGNGGRANGTVTLTAPSDTPSGTDVTLTIVATDPGASDFNYAVLHLSVVAGVGPAMSLSLSLWFIMMVLFLDQISHL
ncbi:von Willebrand factor A domain-containing protein 7-like [Chanos chanos]|uniref:von Willebrand factor A domain-containing protein 7-like n=1 Tax=Chanos chanos TaxID=29144 RepID=A0A6J2WJ09_CHACN|nr:von Willebrand factor A domain-containing protein 7-like [Chanos chanos]